MKKKPKKGLEKNLEVKQMKFRSKISERGASLYVKVPKFVQNELELKKKDILLVDLLKE